MLDTITFGLVAVSSVVLVVAALLALYRLAVGPTGLDRGVASDVVLAVMIAGIGAHAIATGTSVGLIVNLVLSLVGFTTAVGLARLITGTSARERRFLEAEARAGNIARERAERERAEKERAEQAQADEARTEGGA